MFIHRDVNHSNFMGANIWQKTFQQQRDARINNSVFIQLTHKIIVKYNFNNTEQVSFVISGKKQDTKLSRPISTWAKSVLKLGRKYSFTHKPVSDKQKYCSA